MKKFIFILMSLFYSVFIFAEDKIVYTVEEFNLDIHENEGAVYAIYKGKTFPDKKDYRVKIYINDLYNIMDCVWYYYNKPHAIGSSNIYKIENDVWANFNIDNDLDKFSEYGVGDDTFIYLKNSNYIKNAIIEVSVFMGSVGKQVLSSEGHCYIDKDTIPWLLNYIKFNYYNELQNPSGMKGSKKK